MMHIGPPGRNGRQSLHAILTTIGLLGSLLLGTAAADTRKASTTLKQALQPYDAFRISSVLAWHPHKSGLVVSTNSQNGTALYHVSQPGSSPAPLNDVAGAALFQQNNPDHLATPDGKGTLRLARDEKNILRLMHHDETTGKQTILTSQFDADVQEFAVSWQAGRIALITHELGSDVLRFLDARTFAQLPRPALLSGLISNLRWNNAAHQGDGLELAFTLSSSRSPGDVYTFNTKTTRMMRWTNGTSPHLNPLHFADPKVVRTQAQDTPPLHALLYQPDPVRHAGRRPVLIEIQPQVTQRFLGPHNYLVSDMGVALLRIKLPQAAGHALPATTPQHTAQEIATWINWIKQQSNLDNTRILLADYRHEGHISQTDVGLYSQTIKGVLLLQAAAGKAVAPPVSAPPSAPSFRRFPPIIDAATAAAPFKLIRQWLPPARR